MNIQRGSFLLIESSFGNPKPKVQLLARNVPFQKCSVTLTLLGAKLFLTCFQGNTPFQRRNDCGGIFPCFLSFSPSHSPQRQIMAERSHDAALLEGEIMTSSLVVVAAASTPVLLKVGFGCQDGCPYLKEACWTLGSCKFVDTVKHIGPHQGIDQGASTEGAVRV